jgi:hypothetical protein
VTTVAAGTLTIEVDAITHAAARPWLEVCCLSGDARGGNPVTVPVTAGTEVSVDVGQTGAAIIPSPAVLVKTALQPL